MEFLFIEYSFKFRLNGLVLISRFPCSGLVPLPSLISVPKFISSYPRPDTLNPRGVTPGKPTDLLFSSLFPLHNPIIIGLPDVPDLEGLLSITMTFPFPFLEVLFRKWVPDWMVNPYPVCHGSRVLSISCLPFFILKSNFLTKFYIIK